MSTTPTTYEQVLAERLQDLSRPENQGEGLRRHDFYKLLLITVILPLIALAVGWVL
jgi:hypothetical protein